MSTIRFEAKLVETDGSSEILLTPPKSASGKLPAGTTMVEGVINHFPFRAEVEHGKITISDAIRKAARADLPRRQAGVGDTIAVELTRVGDEPETRVPADLVKALKANVKAQTAWEKITPMARRDWILSILVVRQAETRQIRLAKTTDMLAHGKGRICCFPGLNWMTRDYVSKAQTWQSLPK